MGYRYTGWEDRAVDVPGLDPAPAFGSFTADATMLRTDASATNGATTPGTYPWRDSGNRIATADRARNRTSPSHGSTSDAETFLTTPPDTQGRIGSMTALVGVQAFTTADRTLIGTYYDDFTFGMWLGQLSLIVGDSWLANLYEQPQTTTTGRPKTLTPDEWATLWGSPPVGYYFREVDVTGCSVELQPAVDFEAASAPTPAGTITRRAVTSATAGSAWYPSGTIDAEPYLGAVTGASTWSLTGATGPLSDPVHGPHYVGGGPLGTGGLVTEFELPSVVVPWGIAGGDTSATYAEWMTYDPQWPTGVDPGFDETGGIPPVDPASRVYRGGTGADRWARVRLQMTWRFTVRMRWVGITGGAPPLWQRQRIGVMDSPEQFASGLVTPQSSPWQGGML